MHWKKDFICFNIVEIFLMSKIWMEIDGISPIINDFLNGIIMQSEPIFILAIEVYRLIIIALRKENKNKI